MTPLVNKIYSLLMCFFAFHILFYKYIYVDLPVQYLLEACYLFAEFFLQGFYNGICVMNDQMMNH